MVYLLLSSVSGVLNICSNYVIYECITYLTSMIIIILSSFFLYIYIQIELLTLKPRKTGDSIRVNTKWLIHDSKFT